MAEVQRVQSDSNYNQRAQRARSRAYRKLAAAHVKEFIEILTDERAKEGLQPADPEKFHGTRPERTS